MNIILFHVTDQKLQLLDHRLYQLQVLKKLSASPVCYRTISMILIFSASLPVFVIGNFSLIFAQKYKVVKGESHCDYNDYLSDS